MAKKGHVPSLFSHLCCIFTVENAGVVGTHFCVKFLWKEEFVLWCPNQLRKGMFGVCAIYDCVEALFDHVEQLSAK